MKRLSLTALVFALLCVIITAVATFATVPQTMGYQGRLTDAAGDPVVDAAYLVKFTIYDAAVAGAVLWNSGFQNVNTVEGLFSYTLGSNVALPDLFSAGADRYLGITVGVDPEMTPRSEMSSMAWAYHAGTADAVDWVNITGIPGGFADNTDDNTVYTAGAGLQLAGTVFSIPNGGVTSAMVLDNTLTSADLAANSVTASEIAANAVGTSEVQDNSLTSNDLAANSVGASELGSNSVSSVNIIDNSVTGADIQNSTITGTDIAANTITAADIATNGVGAAEISANAVGQSEIATSGVASSEVQNNSLLDIDILDEPGVAQLTNPGPITLSATTSTIIESRIINCPTSGFILAVYSAEFGFTHVNGNTSGYTIFLTNNGTSVSGSVIKNVIWASGNPSGANDFIISLNRIFTAVAGNNTINLVANKFSGDPNATFDDRSLSLVFFPTAYGTVASPPTPPGADDGENHENSR